MSESNKLQSLAAATLALLAPVSAINKRLNKTRGELSGLWMQAYCLVITGIWSDGFYRAPGKRASSESFFEAMGEQETISESKAKRLWDMSQRALAEPAFSHKVKGIMTADSLKGLREAAEEGAEQVMVFLADKGIKSESDLAKAVYPPKEGAKAEMVARFYYSLTVAERKELTEQVKELVAEYDAKAAEREAEKAAADAAKAAAKAAKALAKTQGKLSGEIETPAAVLVKSKNKANGVDETGRTA